LHTALAIAARKEHGKLVVNLPSKSQMLIKKLAQEKGNKEIMDLVQ
jgi:hypothetical protein